VKVGETISMGILETWAPAARRPESLPVSFRFQAPSQRSFELQGRHVGEHRYEVQFRPDELGLWTYSWWTRPDTRFEEQTGGGFFTVVRNAGDLHTGALRALVEGAIEEASRSSGILARRRSHFRLASLQREIRASLTEEQSRDPTSRRQGELRDLLRDIVRVLPNVE
jgi:hypothetical protein